MYPLHQPPGRYYSYDLPGNLRTGLGAPHYVRNKYNQSDNAKKEKGGIEMSAAESSYHGEGNKKFVSPDGHDELVVDSNKDPITEETDPENMGTYNVFNPRGNAAEKTGHVIVDVVPYIFFGNAPSDPSDLGDRLEKTGQGIKKTFEEWKAANQVPQASNL